MMDDPSINFYDVVDAAEEYFETHPKGKGSGWKPYQRWKAENESKYYPDGDRSQISPYYVSEAYAALKQDLSLPNKNKTAANELWRELGPGTVQQITGGYSSGIGRVVALWVNPNNTQQIYMGSRSGGFWKTIDGGSSWVTTTDTMFATGVNTIVASESQPDSILINVQNSQNQASHGIYRSVDGGDSWTITAFNPINIGWGGLGDNDRIYKIVIHPNFPNLIFIGTSKGLYRSDDQLQTWTLHQGGARITDIEFHPTNDSIIYTFDDNNTNKLFISNDLGLTYTSSGNLSGNGNAQVFLAVSPVCPTCIYAASSDGLWKSKNEGASFQALPNPSQSCFGFAVNDLDTNQMLYGYLDVLASNDGGQNFNQVSWWANSNPDPTYIHADLRTAECINGVYFVGTDGYLAKTSDNGNTWTRLNQGTGIRENYALGVSQSNAYTEMVGSQDNGTSIRNANGWIEWYGADGMEAVIHPLNPDWMMGSVQFGARGRTKDGGQNRNSVSGTGSADWQAPLLINPNHQMTVYHFDASLHKSDEFGNNMQPISTPIIGLVKVAAIAENNSNIMVMARNSQIRLTTDEGVTYTNIRGSLPNYSVTDLAFDPKRDSTIIVTYGRYQNDGNKIYISYDLGATWNNITANLGKMPIRTVAIDHSDSSFIYVGAEIGVYYKSMNGSTWKLMGNNLPNVTIRDLEIQYGSNTLKAAAWGRGVWEAPLVDRSNYPKIVDTRINDLPTLTTPKENVPQKVVSKISNSSTVTNAYVKWSVSKPVFDQTIPMANISDSTWESQTAIQNFPMDSLIYFKVFAENGNGDITETYRFMYKVRFNFSASIVSNDFADHISVSPNPSQREFTIDLGRTHPNLQMEIRDITGRLVQKKTFNGLDKIPVTIDGSEGVYMVKLYSQEGQAVIKLIKQN